MVFIGSCANLASLVALLTEVGLMLSKFSFQFQLHGWTCSVFKMVLEEHLVISLRSSKCT